MLQKLNRDHVTKVALKNQGKLKKLKKTKREFDFVVPTMERLCEAKLIHHEGNALRSKAFSSKWICFAKQSQSITMERPFAEQSQSSKMERLCEAKPIQQNGKALRSEANQSK